MGRKKKYQDGGPVNPTDQSVRDWTQSYINSPKYRERLGNFWQYPGYIQGQRSQQIAGTTFTEGSGRTAYSDTDSYPNQLNINMEQLNRIGAGRDEAAAHELGHATNASRTNPALRLNPLEEQYILNRNRSATPEFRSIATKGAADSNETISQFLQGETHDLAPSESKSDIDSLRYLMSKEKIYDAGTQDITPEILKKAKSNPAIKKAFSSQRLFKNFGDDALLEILNKVAVNQTQQSDMANYGKKMKKPKYDNGGNILEFAHIFNYGGKLAYCDVPMLAGIKELEMTPANMIAESGIHIKPQNRGKFTAAAEKAGMGVQEYANKIMRNPGNYSPTLVKRANFARNANKWHKAEYGIDIPSYMGIKALDNIKTLEMAPPGSIPRAQNGYGGPGPWDQYMQPYPQPIMMDPMQNTRPPVTSALPPGAGQPMDLSQATDQLGYAPNEGPQWNMPEQEPQGGIAGAATAVGEAMPNIHINAGAAITGLAGLVTKAAKRAQATNEFARLKRRNLTMQTYNPIAYGTGSQAIGMQGIKVGGKSYHLTPAQTQFLKKQGYKI